MDPGVGGISRWVYVERVDSPSIWSLSKPTILIIVLIKNEYTKVNGFFMFSHVFHTLYILFYTFCWMKRFENSKNLFEIRSIHFMLLQTLFTLKYGSIGKKMKEPKSQKEQ